MPEVVSISMLLWNPPQFLVENIKWVRLSSFTYFPKEFSLLILKLNFNNTTDSETVFRAQWWVTDLGLHL